MITTIVGGATQFRGVNWLTFSMTKLAPDELAERIKVLRPATKALFMSGYTDDAVLRHGVLDEGVPFLQKPVTPALLTRRVRETLDAG